mgnify:CR=1 FL=1
MVTVFIGITIFNKFFIGGFNKIHRFKYVGNSLKIRTVQPGIYYMCVNWKTQCNNKRS